MKARWLALGMGLAAAGSIAANAGTDISGGLDVYSPTPAWFLGSAPVKTCLRVAPDFGVDRLTLLAAFQDATQQWKDYAVTKRLFESWWYGGDGDLAPSFDYELLPDCDGSEELTLLFGIQTPAVEKALQKFVKPLAFSQRGSYDAAKGRGTGFIWFARLEPSRSGRVYADWTRASFRHGVLVHELGHVLGNEHMSGTIMDGRLGSVALRVKEGAYAGWEDNVKALDGMFTSIDWNREVVHCSMCSVDETSEVLESVPFDAGFSLLMGRDAVGRARARLQLEEGVPPTVSSLPPRRGRLVVSDELETVEFPFVLREMGHGSDLDNDAFRTLRQARPDEDMAGFYERTIPRWGTTHYAQLTKRDGGRLIGILSRNIDQQTPLTMSLLKQDASGVQEIPLFYLYRTIILRDGWLSPAAR